MKMDTHKKGCIIRKKYSALKGLNSHEHNVCRPVYAQVFLVSKWKRYLCFIMWENRDSYQRQ